MGSIVREDARDRYVFRDFDGTPFEGSAMTGERVIINFVEGYISSSDGHPAVDDCKGHVEFWDKGLLHRKGAPAIIDIEMGIEEYWEMGVFIRTVAIHDEK